MRTFTIDPDNNITVLVEVPAGAEDIQSFTNQKELAKLMADWPISRLVDTWNSFAGVTPFTGLKPVKKFTDRQSAIARIWKAVERLLPDVAHTAADVAPVSGKREKRAEKGKRGDKTRDKPHTAAKDSTPERGGSKKVEVLDLMRRPHGATLAEIMELTGWQAHTVRGFISGTVTRKLRLKVESFRTDNKARAYRIR